MPGPEQSPGEDIPTPPKLEARLQAAFARLQIQPGLVTAHHRGFGLAYGLGETTMLGVSVALKHVDGEAGRSPVLSFELEAHPDKFLDVFASEPPDAQLVTFFEPFIREAQLRARARGKRMDKEWLQRAWVVARSEGRRKLGAASVGALLDTAPPGVIIGEWDESRLSQTYANGAIVVADWITSTDPNFLSLQTTLPGRPEFTVRMERPDGRLLVYERLDDGVELMDATEEDPASPYARTGEPRVLEIAWQLAEALEEAYAAGPAPKTSDPPVL